MKKIPTLFVRDFTRDNGKYVTDQVTPGCEWVLAGEGVATRKFDGTCIAVRNGSVLARREVKAGKTPPPGFIEVQADEKTGKRVGYEPVQQSSFEKFVTEALIYASAPIEDGTYELVGPKVNGNPERYAQHTLVRHGAERLILGPRLSFLSIRRDVLTLARESGCEGIVWHHPDGRMAKIKARDFRKDNG